MKKALVSYCCTQLSYQQNLQLMAQCGFEGAMLQWKDSLIGESKQRQIELCQQYNLDIVNLHCDYQYCNTLWQKDCVYDKHLIQLVEACDKYGIPVAVVHLSSSNTPPAPSMLGIERLQKVVQRAQKLGVQLAFENLRMPVFNKFVFDNLDSPVIGVCYDCGHDNVYCKDYDVLKYLARPVWTTHLHDNNGQKDQHLLPFCGTVNWDNVIDKLSTRNVQTINIESHCDSLDLEVCKQFVQQAAKCADTLAQQLTDRYNS